ncbi:GIY-YIG nuclease family protein [Botryobacter ruber]|uniref:GIY-YIG nuclease family protein n=1 Tax=Botryobacter ruber TaxID=2171629 RepID=UPI001F0C26D6|nr:GIY-YIG nuclease family protein [Botryobacter ruber]
MLFSEKTNRYYVGSTEDLPRRLGQHNSGRNKSTKAGMPWLLKHTEEFPTSVAARQRESEIKRKKSRKYIERLISSAG